MILVKASGGDDKPEVDATLWFAATNTAKPSSYLEKLDLVASIAIKRRYTCLKIHNLYNIKSYIVVSVIYKCIIDIKAIFLKVKIAYKNK